MDLQLAPEDKQLIREIVDNGSFASAGEFVHTAIRVYQEQTRFLAAQADLDVELGRRLAALDRGESISEATLLANLQPRKSEWLKTSRD